MITFEQLRNHPTVYPTMFGSNSIEYGKNWHSFLALLWGYIYQFDVETEHIILHNAAQEAIDKVMYKDVNYAKGYVLGVIEQTYFNIFGEYPK